MPPQIKFPTSKNLLKDPLHGVSNKVMSILLFRHNEEL